MSKHKQTKQLTQTKVNQTKVYDQLAEKSTKPTLFNKIPITLISDNQDCRNKIRKKDTTLACHVSLILSLIKKTHKKTIEVKLLLIFRERWNLWFIKSKKEGILPEDERQGFVIDGNPRIGGFVEFEWIIEARWGKGVLEN
jgi:hypothetical protein